MSLSLQSQFRHHKEVEAAQGVKIVGKDLDKVMAGLPMYVARYQDEIEVYKVCDTYILLTPCHAGRTADSTG